INDLYFALDVRGAELAWTSLVKGVALGVGGPLLASIGPAREATGAPPRLTLQRSAIESRARHHVPRSVLLGLAVSALAAVLLALPTRDLLPAFAGVFAVVVGFACLVPGAILVASRALVPLAARLFGGVGRLAARGVEATLSRTGIAVAALVIAVATTLGIAIMVSSFRATLIDWLEVTLQADVYVTSTQQNARGESPPLDPAWIDDLSSASGVAHVTTYRRVLTAVDGVGESRLHAVHMSRRAFEIFRFADAGSDSAADRDALYGRFAKAEGVLVSEPYAYRHGLTAGDRLTVRSANGPVDTTILAVFYDYASDRGVMMAHRAFYDRHWADPAIHSLGLYLDSGQDADAAVERLRALVPTEAVIVVPNRELKRSSLEIFDRTFRITGVLRILAVAVAFLGILSALMALQLERARELGVLRATGLVPRQVWALVTAQTGLLGLLSGLLAVPLGTLLATLLIHVINKRSFGWTLHMEIPPSALLQTIALALVAALLAGLWPAHRMARSSPALALREE
ncbi:MAG: FtsX-like permease family protein, partial [Acidobacteriota bacterium]